MLRRLLDEEVNDVVNRAWVGQWIAHSSSDEALGPVTDFQRLIFRREFDADGAGGRIAISADARYALYLNGVRIGAGPVRSQPRRWTFDEHDLGEHLQPGRNVIVALVTWYGGPNAFWFAAGQESGLGGRPTLIADLEVDGHVLGTDESWQVAPAPAWVQPPRAYYDGIPVDAVDLRELPEGWQQGVMDGLDWCPATPLPAHHLGGLSRTRPPANPYGVLAPRPLGPLGGDRLVGRATRAWLVDELAVTARPTDDVQLALSRAHRPAGPEARLEPGQGLLVEVDFGRVLAGLAELHLDAPEGSVVDTLHRERRLEPGVPQDGPPTGSRVVTRGGTTNHLAQELCGLRFAYLLVRAPRGGDVRLDELALLEQVQQWQGEAHFRSSEPGLEELWAAGLRTTQLCSLDAFVDCPTREQRAWLGDGVVPSLVHLVSNADHRPVWRYLELGASLRPDGILPMALAGETEGSQGVTIPAWTLHWAHALHAMWLHDPDGERIRALMPELERALRWFERHQDASGVIADVPEWNMVDWSSVFTNGRSSVLTALWVRALREFAVMQHAFGNAGSARWARACIARAGRGFVQFWDERRGCVLDHIAPEGAGGRLAASQLAQATALLAGLAPDARRVAAWLTMPRLVERTLLQTGGRFDQRRFDDYVRGQQLVDWDVERESVVAGPFGAHLVNEAMRQLDDAGPLLASLDRWHRFLVDGYDTFGEQWSHLDGTPAHGWSSCPSVDLVQSIAGIRPSGPGFGRVAIEPMVLPGPLELDVCVPTPAGPLRLVRGGGRLVVDSPLPVRWVDGGVARSLPAGRHELREGPARSRLRNIGSSATRKRLTGNEPIHTIHTERRSATP